jgi:hypothetical protein
VPVDVVAAVLGALGALTGFGAFTDAAAFGVAAFGPAVTGRDLGVDVVVIFGVFGVFGVFGPAVAGLLLGGPAVAGMATSARQAVNAAAKVHRIKVPPGDHGALFKTNARQADSPRPQKVP